VNAAIRRLDEFRTRMAEVQRRQADSSQQVASLDRALKEGNWGRADAGGPSAEEMQQVLTMRRRELAQINAELQHLTAEESSLAIEVTTEQARWTEFNQKVEDLEHALRPLK